MTASALWLPFAVNDIDAAERFYTDHFGLSQVDSWSNETERGVVLRVAGATNIELVSPGTPGKSPLAFQLADIPSVENAFAEWRGHPEGVVTKPHRFPRGHYGFQVRGPAGAPIMVWSEKE